MEISEIKDRKSFQAWLEDKPKEWAQVLAARVALRVAPIVWSVVTLSEDVLEKKHRGDLILLTFRANFISSLARKYPTDDMKRAASAAFAARVFNAPVDVVDAVDAATYAAYAVDAAAYAVHSAAYAVDAAAYAAMSDAAFGTAADAGNAAINSFWACIRADCYWLEALAEGNYDYSVTQAQALSNEPLWIKFAAPDTLPMALKEKFHEFNESELAQTTSFGLITDWYRSILQGKPSPFSKEAELAIAKMSPIDWGDGDHKRDCVAVMDRVAAIARWERQKSLGDILVDALHEPNKELPYAVQNVASPFEYAWNASGLVTLEIDALACLSIPDSRNPQDGANRLEAARIMAQDLVTASKEGVYQINQSYASSLRRYAEFLPGEVEQSIYLADMEIRNLRDDLEDDIKYGINERFARRLKRVIEQHYGLRPYFPDLLNFYDDVREGALSEPPPIDTINELKSLIKENTPDVFDESVNKTINFLESEDRKESAEEISLRKDVQDSDDSLSLPNDPIADIDPERAKQHATSGALNKVYEVLHSAEKSAKNVEKAEKTAKTFWRVGEPLFKWLSEFADKLP